MAERRATPKAAPGKRTSRAKDGPARLDTYLAKRDFAASPEPGGARRRRAAAASLWDRLPQGHRFCVQLHRASRLHYDFRLEYEGVLLSWAVPKGPSMDPRQRRLAVQVEDHPVDYGDFEDVIPSGYGAGTVLIWDMGEFRWEKGPKGDAQAGLRDGHLDFHLEGQRLRGAFSLIRMEGRRQGDQPQWLLMKRKEPEVADEADPVAGATTSVKTGRTLDQVAEGAAAKSPPPERGLAQALAGAPRASLPVSLSPMLATLVEGPFSDPAWLFELKYDGVRCLLRRERGQVTLQGRSGRDETARYPEVQEAGKALRASSCLVDGEIVALDAEGRPSFAKLQSRIQLRPQAAARAASELPVVFMAFDLLFASGRDLRRLPLERRKQALRLVVEDGPSLRYADEVLAEGEALYAEVRRHRLEGVLAKRLASAYQTGRRSRDWLKIKVRQTQDCVICGYLPGRGRRQELGALLLGVFAEGQLVPAGKVGTGFSERELGELRQQLDRRRRSSPPWSGKAAEASGAVFAEPELVCEVEHAGWTVGGRLRQPAFRTLRPDVPPRACVREAGVEREEVRLTTATKARAPAPSVPPPSSELASALEQLAQLPDRGGQLEVGERQVSVTHLDKLLWPEDGVRKRDLIAYHLQLAEQILPHLRDRAVVMQVFPDGIAKPGFWRRSVPAGAPKWLPRWRAHPGEPTICPLIQEPAALVWLANQGAIEFHPWHSRRDRPTQPDWAVFDLDPGPGAGWDQAVEVGRLVKRALDELGLRGFAKTTGQSGLHIYLPLRRGPEQQEVRDWVGELAHLIAESAPQLVTETWAVKGRRGKLRIDHTQNVVGKTLAAVYSPRPVAGAPVSAPMAWDELAGLDRAQLNLWSLPARVARLGDLFAPVLQDRQRLARLSEAKKERGRPGRPARRK